MTVGYEDSLQIHTTDPADFQPYLTYLHNLRAPDDEAWQALWRESSLIDTATEVDMSTSQTLSGWNIWCAVSSLLRPSLSIVDLGTGCTVWRRRNLSAKDSLWTFCSFQTTPPITSEAGVKGGVSELPPLAPCNG